MLLGVIFFTCNAQATWCLPTHLVHNKELTKIDKEGEPFKIGTLDKAGYYLAVIKDSVKFNYRYLRTIKIDSLDFREFRDGSFKFQLAMPNENGVMIYRNILVDDKGVERGFAGYCS